MNNTRHIHIADYDYPLPEDRIAKYPLAQRDHSKLLVYNHGCITDDLFCNLPDYLPKGGLMVFNNTRVIQARIHFHKETGALIEVFLMEPAQPTDYELMFQSRGRCSWFCMVGNLKKWKDGPLRRDFSISGSQTTLSAALDRSKTDPLSSTNYWVDFEWDNQQLTFADILESVGELPIPPYLRPRRATRLLIRRSIQRSREVLPLQRLVCISLRPYLMILTHMA